jgi:hypothetical protein
LRFFFDLGGGGLRMSGITDADKVRYNCEDVGQLSGAAAAWPEHVEADSGECSRPAGLQDLPGLQQG